MRKNVNIDVSKDSPGRLERLKVTQHALFKEQYPVLLYLSVSTRAVIGQFSRPYFPVRHAKI